MAGGGGVANLFLAGRGGKFQPPTIVERQRPPCIYTQRHKKRASAIDQNYDNTKKKRRNRRSPLQSSLYMPYSFLSLTIYILNTTISIYTSIPPSLPPALFSCPFTRRKAPRKPLVVARPCLVVVCTLIKNTFPAHFPSLPPSLPPSSPFTHVLAHPSLHHHRCHHPCSSPPPPSSPSCPPSSPSSFLLQGKTFEVDVGNLDAIEEGLEGGKGGREGGKKRVGGN